eukprot:4689418-Pyramimonas_sp.AAC.1
MRKSDSRLPRRGGNYRQLDLLSSQLARIFCDRSPYLWQWAFPQCADVPTDLGEYRAALAAWSSPACRRR